MKLRNVRRGLKIMQGGQGPPPPLKYSPDSHLDVVLIGVQYIYSAPNLTLVFKFAFFYVFRIISEIQV